MQAIQNGSPEVVARLLQAMDEAQALEELPQTTVVLAIAQRGDGQVCTIVLDAMLEKIPVRQVRDPSRAQSRAGISITTTHITWRTYHVCSPLAHAQCALAALLRRRRCRRVQVAAVFSSAVHDISVAIRGARDRKSLALSMLLQHGARPDPEDLVLLSCTVESESLEDCFVQAVSAAGNPFIPSLNISFGLDVAIGMAPDMERKVLIQLRHGINRLLAETLRWLPQTVRDLPGGMAACNVLFEPELICMHCVDGTDGSGPLAAALKCTTRVVTFATKPLAMDYMLQKFTRGLPGLLDSGRAVSMEVPRADRREEGKGQDSLTAYALGSTLGVIMTSLGKNLSRDSLCGLTLLPGAHFVVMGIVSVTNSYYKTPVMRMVFDLIVYVGVLALFTINVLCHDEGSIKGGEIAFVVWVVVSHSAMHASHVL